MLLQNNRINNLKHLEAYRKRLRNNQTDAEKILWQFIRKRKLCGRKFRRQFSILNYILDFYCVEEKIAIELDGKQHLEPAAIRKDAERDNFLRGEGIKVLRFQNWRVVKELSGVLREVKESFNDGWSFKS